MRAPLFRAGPTALVVAAACGGGGEPTSPPPPPPPPASVVATVRVASATVDLGGTIVRTAQVENSAGNAVSVPVTWSTDQPGIATVSPAGQVAGLAAGEATIRATAEGKNGSATISVRDLRWSQLPQPNFPSCGLTTAGELYCWGSVVNGVGGPAADAEHETCPAGEWCYSTPRRLSTAQSFTSIAVGRTHVCGLTTGGAAWCWGGNDLGQLGAATTETCAPTGLPCSRTPIAVGGGKLFVSLVANRHTCGLTAGGEAWCWGQNDHGQLGATTAGGFSQVPVRAGGALLFSALATGYLHTCGIALDGLTYCWGNPPGLGSTRFEGPDATVVTGGHVFTAISAGDAHSCGLTASGAAFCWGAGGQGQLGRGAFVSTETPFAVAGGHTFASLSAGHFYTCGLDTAGKGWCWGLNFHASLGIGGPAPTVCGDGTCATTPIAVSGNRTYTALVAGNWVTCGLATTSKAYCWGRNAFGGLGTGKVDGVNQFAPVGVAGAP